MVGKVYLVGAGPGDPDLITVKALRLIRAADVVIYDRLIPHAVLDETRPDAELIDAGKTPTKHRLEQDAINTLIVAKAAVGRLVVRLKGGDPFVFGRGSEEALVCRAAGVPFEVVPGVSSPIAVPAYAGIPVTHRGITSTFTVIAGHEAPGDADSSIDYDALARIGGTLVILMGVQKIRGILTRLCQAGLSGSTPAAAIEWGTTPAQRVLVGTIDTLADLAAEAGIMAPATTIVGEVVRLRLEGVQWFEDVLAETAASWSLPGVLMPASANSSLEQGS